MMIPLAIVDLAVELHVPRSLGIDVLRRYGDFVRPRHALRPASALRLVAPESPLASRYHIPTPPRIEITALGPKRFDLKGDCVGQLDLKAMRGEIRGPDTLIALDALLRLSLSLLAPEAEWLFLHGAAVALKDGRWSLFLGRSGAGKSTAARTFRSFCDELVLARPGRTKSEAASTPFWNGQPGREECGAIVCLNKGGEIGAWRLREAEAVRALAPHAVRYVRFEQSEKEIMALLCALAHRVPVFSIRCPIGLEFIPFVRKALSDLGIESHEQTLTRKVPVAVHA